MAQLDDFTLSLLTNDEVIEVNQDPMGKQGIVIAEQGNIVTYAKPFNGCWFIQPGQYDG